MNKCNSEIMKRYLFALSLILFIPVIRTSAQTPNLDKLNAYKIGFFTKKLNLTSTEAEKFWPIYNEYQREKNIIQKSKISLIRNFNQNESALDDKEMTEIGDKLIGYIVEESSLSVSFHKQLKEVLPSPKVIRFYQAENQYKVQLLNELQSGNRPQHKGNPGRGL